MHFLKNAHFRTVYFYNGFTPSKRVETSNLFYNFENISQEVS